MSAEELPKKRSLEELSHFLAQLPAGRVSLANQPKLLPLLQDCWPLFRGSSEESMANSKLERMEEPEWNPPILTFRIERHGGTALGSTRADMQCWSVDLDSLEADHWTRGYRQLQPRGATLKVEPIADELSKLIMSHSEDERLQWSAAGRVRIRMSKVLPPGPKRTLEGRRKRLVRMLEERLAPHGWRLSGAWWELTSCQ